MDDDFEDFVDIPTYKPYNWEVTFDEI